MKQNPKGGALSKSFHLDEIGSPLCKVTRILCENISYPVVIVKYFYTI